MSLRPDDTPELLRQIEKLKKINAALISHAERPHAVEPNAFTLFENAATVDRKVRDQTEELRQALRVLEHSNDALQQAKQIAEAANALKTSFLASVSHDLLQPLHAARLTLSVLNEAGLAPSGQKLLGQTDRSLRTLEDIIKTLLDLSKLDAGVSKPEIGSVSAASVIDDLFAEFGPLAADRNLILRRRGSCAEVETDPLMLRRILQNLLSNAIRYTRRGGVLLCCTRQHNSLRIDIADTGPGIRHDRKAAIFEEFQRDDQGATEEPGFGLGLAIVRRLALTLNHQIKLWSRPGVGSVFSIFVPCADGKTLTPTEAARPLPAPFEDVQVLCVASDISLLGPMLPLLEAWGCDVMMAATCADARAHLQQAGRAPDLLMAGCRPNDRQVSLDIISTLRQDAQLPIPSVILGIEHDAEAQAQGIETLPLPLKPAEVRTLIAHLLQPPSF